MSEATRQYRVLGQLKADGHLLIGTKLTWYVDRKEWECKVAFA